MLICNKLNKELIYIDRNLQQSAKNMILKLTSRSSNITTSFLVTDENKMINYYVFAIDFSELSEGEYEYKLITDDVSSHGDILASGLIKIVGKNEDAKTYMNGIQYKIYDPFTDQNIQSTDDENQ